MVGSFFTGMRQKGIRVSPFMPSKVFRSCKLAESIIHMRGVCFIFFTHTIYVLYTNIVDTEHMATAPCETDPSNPHLYSKKGV